MNIYIPEVMQMQKNALYITYLFAENTYVEANGKAQYILEVCVDVPKHSVLPCCSHSNSNLTRA